MHDDEDCYDICEDCEFDIEEAVDIFDDIDQIIDAYRAYNRSREVTRQHVLGGALTPKDVETMSAIFDMLWPKEGAS